MKDEEENDNSKLMRISSVQRFFKLVETNIFNFFYTLLEDKEEFYYFNLVCITITFIQAIGFGFRDDVSFLFLNVLT